MTPDCLIAMYHYVRDTAATPYPRLNALSLEDFDTQLDGLTRARAVVDYSELERAVLSRQPLRQPAALLTFDDGFVDHYDAVLPRLQSRGLAGVFFLAGAAIADPPRVLNVHKTHFLVETIGAAAFVDAVKRALHVRPVAVGGGLSKTPDV